MGLQGDPLVRRQLYYVAKLDPDADIAELTVQPPVVGPFTEKNPWYCEVGVLGWARWRWRRFRGDDDGRERVADNDELSANTISSELVDAAPRMHAVTIDLDHPAKLLHSSTPGHYHLLIDVAMPWRKYRRLLRAMTKAGILEKGYYRAMVRRRATFLRRPGAYKEGMPTKRRQALDLQQIATDTEPF